MNGHQLLKIKGGWQCSVCCWIWTSKPASVCPGVPRYSWEGKPESLLTKTQLGKLGLKLAPNQKVCGVVQSGTGKEWWQLYDKTEALPKQKKSPPSKSTRPPCPIGLDCLLVAATRGKPCPNKDYCAHQVAPWKLPYEIRWLKDGTCCLLVVAQSRTTSEREEKEQCGWVEARHLPYQYCKGSEGQPLLYVSTYSIEHKKGGWCQAEYLPDSYFAWAVVRMGMPYEEYRERDWYYLFRDSPYSFEPMYKEEDLPEYPHCILLSKLG